MPRKARGRGHNHSARFSPRINQLTEQSGEDDANTSRPEYGWSRSSYLEPNNLPANNHCNGELSGVTSEESLTSSFTDGMPNYSGGSLSMEQEEVFKVGQISWAKFANRKWWPGMPIGSLCGNKPPKPGLVWIYWFGDHMVSETTHQDNVVPFTKDFTKYHKTSAGKVFKKGVLEAIQECASRSGQTFHDDEESLEWAKQGFKIAGQYTPELFRPSKACPVPKTIVAYLTNSSETREEEEVVGDDGYTHGNELTRGYDGQRTPQRKKKTHLQRELGNLLNDSVNFLDGTLVNKPSRCQSPNQETPTVQKRGLNSNPPRSCAAKKLKYTLDSDDEMDVEQVSDFAQFIKDAVNKTVTEGSGPKFSRLNQADKSSVDKTKEEVPSSSLSSLQSFKAINETGDGIVGNISWAKFANKTWWPGMPILGSLCGKKPAKPGFVWIYWFGDHRISETTLQDNVRPFTKSYKTHFENNAGKLFKKGVLEAIQECAFRAGLTFDDADDAFEWAIQGFKIGKQYSPEVFEPDKECPVPKSVLKYLADHRESAKEEEKLKVERVKPLRIESQAKATGDVLADVRAGTVSIEEVCIACDKKGVETDCQHPFFEGGLCSECKEELLTTTFVYDDDGTNMYCTICGNGGELFVCEKGDCGRVYCTGCIKALVCESELDRIRQSSPWSCYICVQDGRKHGLLKSKVEWQTNLMELFQVEEDVQVPLPSSLDFMPKRPLRVLSLFDGIGTGKLVLDQLGLEVEAYFASETDEDAIRVTQVKHGAAVTQIGDIQKLGHKELAKLGRIDLVIGGSPCNDLSLVNPARKGISDGTGLLFFDFYRVLSRIQALNQDHVFWLYENVVSILKDAKTTISRFLECRPRMLDAKDFSAQHRARYFWGNIPGMYCRNLLPQSTQNLTLDDMLTPNCNRVATVQKIRTVTTRSNSLMQGKTDSFFPVKMNGQNDRLWMPEIERIFGFPVHYTDVGNMNSGRRQKLLGKSWSVPVIEYLLTPLKQFYATK